VENKLNSGNKTKEIQQKSCIFKVRRKDTEIKPKKGTEYKEVVYAEKLKDKFYHLKKRTMKRKKLG
jgi:hypothetical protein